MKVLYIAGRWDPSKQDEYSGNDYGSFHAIKKQPEVDLALVGPMDFQPNLLERVTDKFYRKFTGKRWFKYSLSYPHKSAAVINAALQDTVPDVIFSKYSAPLTNVEINVPFIYMCDSIIPFSKHLAREFSSPAYALMEQWERNVIRKASRVITYSHACADLIVSEYDTPASKVVVMPIPAFVPTEILSDDQTQSVELTPPLRLLFVGKRSHLRGVDIAIQIVKKLNQDGIPAELRIVGMKGENEGPVQYMGVYNKEDPQELKNYFQNFRRAHLLLHPSRFHSAGIVISEASAFGLPTITNNVGGLATTVQHEITGIVLPAGSPANSYCAAIESLMVDPDRYQTFRKNALSRFDKELNWEVAGERLFGIIRIAGGFS